MRTFITLALAVAGAVFSAGCASPPPAAAELRSAPMRNAFTMTATLATNPCEAATAADYTRTSVAVRRATRASQAGAIATADLERVVVLGGKAQQLLRDACRDPNKPDQPHLDAARAVVRQVEQLAGGQR